MRFLLISLVFAIGALFIFFAFSTETESPAVSPSETASLSMPAPGAPPEPEMEKPETPAAEMNVINPAVQTGETLIVQFNKEPRSAILNGKTIAVFPYQNDFRAIVPIPLGTKTGTSSIAAEFANGGHFEKTIAVKSGKAKTIVLPPPPKLGMTDKQIVQNLATVNQVVRKTVEEAADIPRFNEPFGLPLYDNRKISSAFGEVRQTGSERITHLGVDFDNPKGRMVAAINAGLVKSAYLDPIYGNTVIVDHGRGVYSLYMHMNTMKVKDGDIVKKGTILGTVGDTGLASAPHLHLSIKINGVSVDPIQFVSAFR